MATSFLNFNNKYAVVGTSKLKATKVGHIYNIKVTDKILENGTIITKGDYIKPETYKQGAGSTEFRGKIIDIAANGNYYVEVDTVSKDLLVAQVPLIYEEYTTRMQHESNFFNEKDDIVRAYELYVGDIFELSAEGFTGAVAKNDLVQVDTSTKKLSKVVSA